MSLLFPAGTRHFRDQVISAVFTLFFGLTPVFVQAQIAGGFLEKPLALTTALEPALTATEIRSFLPEKGKFTFPAPYNTQAVRLTNAADCGGADCVNAIGYSYWRNINNHVGFDTMLIMVGLDQRRGGKGLTLLQYNKVTDQLTNIGPVFDANSPYGAGSGEGWYFSATLPTKIYLNSGSKILRYDVMTKQFETIIDITTKLGAGHIVHQIHSSNDDLVHSATVRDATTYEMQGCMAYETNGEFHYYPKKGDFDECQIDKSGKWLVIKENVDAAEGEDNRIINLDTGNERLLRDSDGAGGHSDLGYGYMIASDNWANVSNTQKLWNFNDSTLRGTTVYSNLDWNASMPAHISHTNSRPDLAPEQQYACGSSANRRNSAEANEIVCFTLDGAGKVLVVAPVMTNLDTRSGDDYDNYPKGNLDVTGQYFIWTSNMGGPRLDVFLVKVPAQLLTGSTGGGTAPRPVTTPPGTSTQPTQPPITSGDTTAPVITSVSAGLVTSTATAVVWLTNESADGSIEYGLTANYGSTASLGATPGTLHSHILNGLEPGTTYHFRVQSVDAAGNAGYSADQVFTTPGLLPDLGGADKIAPVLSGIHASNVGTSAVKVSWITNEPVQQRVEFGKSAVYDHVTTISTAYGMSHDVALENLQPGEVYHYRVRSRDAAGNIATSPDFTLVAGVPSFGTPAPVKWIETVNATANEGWVQKMGGCDGCADAGAASKQKIDERGYLEFTATIENSLRFIGLTDSNGDTTAADIDFGLRLQGNAAEVRENGTYRWELAFVAGDVFRVSLDNGKVTYAKNGTVFYTSTATPPSMLRADVALYSAGSGVANAAIATVANSVAWTDMVNVTADEGSLQKTAGCDGCADARAISQTQITGGGNGHLQFTATVEDKLRIVGLTATATTLPYSLRLQGGVAEVREDGVYRWESAFNAGDVFRIVVEDGVVSYAKNGVAFYTSQVAASEALRAGTVFYSTGGTLKDVVMRTDAQ